MTNKTGVYNSTELFLVFLPKSKAFFDHSLKNLRVDLAWQSHHTDFSLNCIYMVKVISLFSFSLNLPKPVCKETFTQLIPTKIF